MFILNKKSGVISEASNEDVIGHCKKHSDEYAVADTAEELTGAAAPAENPDRQIRSLMILKRILMMQQEILWQIRRMRILRAPRKQIMQP